MRLSLAQVFEEIPRHEHCGIMNALAGLASRWLAVTMGQLGQGGGHHIANRHKCAPSQQTPLMHLLIDPGVTYHMIALGFEALLLKAWQSEIAI